MKQFELDKYRILYGAGGPGCSMAGGVWLDIIIAMLSLFFLEQWIIGLLFGIGAPLAVVILVFWLRRKRRP